MSKSYETIRKMKDCNFFANIRYRYLSFVSGRVHVKEDSRSFYFNAFNYCMAFDYVSAEIKALKNSDSLSSILIDSVEVSSI